MSTDSWKVFSESEAEDVDCIPVGTREGVQRCKISPESMKRLADGGSGEVRWFAAPCG